MSDVLVRDQPTASSLSPEDQVWQLVMAEYDRAMAKFPTWPTNLAEAATVFAEEAGETVKAAAEAWWMSGDPHEVEKEAVQAAAMALRLIIGLRCGHYRYEDRQQNPMVDLNKFSKAV